MNDYSFGFNVYNYPPEDFIEYSNSHKLRHIEINLSKPHSSIASFSPERIDHLKERLDQNGLQLSLHLPYRTNIADNILSLSRSNINYMCSAINLAGKLGAVFLTCHMGFFFWFPVEKWKRTKALKRFIINLTRILEISHSENVIIALENVTPLPQGSEHLLLGDNIEDFGVIFSRMNDPRIKFCLDTGHANLAEGITPYLDNFGDKLIAVHYHDNSGRDDQHLPVGEGTVDWSVLARRLSSMDFHGPFISECRNEKPHESAQKLRVFLL